MGKIRVKTIGIEDEEEKQKLDAKKRQAAKKADFVKKAETAPETETPKKEKKEKFQKANGQNEHVYSKAYVAKATLIDKSKKYSLTEALELLPKLQRAKFDETVELHINVTEQSVSGNVTLPHGSGKSRKIEVVNGQDTEHVDEVLKQIEAGKIEFDVLIATPDVMPRLAKVARFLGPRGLMPNPKNGTVTQKPDEVVKQYAGGHMTFKTEAKSPIIHLSVGKVSFGDKKLEENIKTVIKAVQSGRIKSVTLKSTMSPAIKLQV